MRERKGREAKPFAVMMRDMAVVRDCCELSDAESAALSSPEAPIVLLKKKKVDGLSPSVAPLHDRLGVMLPYAPLHILLFDNGIDVLVMTVQISARSLLSMKMMKRSCGSRALLTLFSCITGQSILNATIR